jgi:type I restriction enzyme S subunit
MAIIVQDTEIKPGYKKTEIGVIPENWEVRPLTGLAIIHHGYGFQSEYFKSLGKYRLTTPGHFYETGGFRDVGEKQKFYGGPLPEGYLLSEGDLIVAMTEQADGLLGSAAIVPVSDTYLHNQRLGRVKVLSPELSIRFLYWVFNSKNYRAKVRETAAGTKVKHTSPSKLLEIPVLLPPTKAEQEAIATVLNDVDALITSLDKLIAKKRDIKQATMQQLLTGKMRLPGFSQELKPSYKQTEVGMIPEDWNACSLGDAVTKVGSGITPTGGEKVYKKEGRPFLRSQNVGWGHLLLGDIVFIDEETHSSFLATEIKLNDVLLNITGASIGRSAVADDRLPGGNVNQHVCIIRPDASRLDSYFLNFSLLSKSGQKQIDSFQAGGNRQGLNFGQIRSFQIPLTSLPEQQAIATVLSDMDAEIVALEQKRDKTRTLKQAMMQELLTGKTRLL